MSTPSLIAMQNPDMSISYIYCHWDGYPEYVGELLKEDYTAVEKVKQLIALGDLSHLGVVPESPKETWDNQVSAKRDHTLKSGYPSYYYCCSYAARGDELKIGYQSSLRRYIKYLTTDRECFNYLYKQGEWLIYNNDAKEFLPYTAVEKS